MKKPSICLVGGHGGSDTGVTHRELVEAEFTYEMQEMLYDRLSSAFKDLNLIVGRHEKDCDPSFKHKHIVAQCARADLVIELHVDEPGKPWSGTHILYHPNNGYTKKIADEGALYVPTALKKKTPVYPAYKSKWPRALNVLEAYGDINALVYEFGWIDNDYEALMNPAIQNESLHAIEHMIAYWLELRSKKLVCER